MKKYVYSFKEGGPKLKNLLGGKGANLCEMVELGLPVPSGFIVTTEACNLYYEEKMNLTKTIQKEIFDQLLNLEKVTKKRLGDSENPLLISVRSGSVVSMPGMMDTILNLGLNDKVVETLSEKTGNKWFVYDSYRRFIGMYADVVMGFSRDSFDFEMDKYKKEKKIEKDQDLTEEDLFNIIEMYKKNYKKLSKEEFPQDPLFQLVESVKAVFCSWSNPRAVSYRKMNNIPDSYGTAVTVQEMVYGNNGNNSGTGVAFSRNPATGENDLYGEFLINAQGEDVVAGIRTPESISKLKEIMPNAYQELYDYAKKLEKHYKDMQDMEFTIENEKLYMLQTRTGKRTAKASLKVAVDLVKESLISKETALLRIEPNQLDNLLHTTFVDSELKKAKIIATGLPASPGAATGKVYFTAEDVVLAKEKGEDAILVRLETSPEDIEGMNSAKGILTVHGGMTSHAAVVARGMGICCISGANVDVSGKKLFAGDVVIKEGEYISLDGNLGNVYLGKIKMEKPSLDDDFEKILNWASKHLDMQVLTNADTPEDAKVARGFRATGIGLCRTEHMFFKEERIFQVRKMILAKTEDHRNRAIEQMKKFQRKDFEEIFKEMDGYSVTIRFLDPPLHEFVPTDKNEIAELAKDLKMTQNDLKKHIDSLKETNPMMGHRGCRLSVTYPELIRMQTAAIIEAAINVQIKEYKVIPELMIPLIGDERELKYLIELIKDEADMLIEKSGVKLKYKVGTMIEVPRAAIIADKIAPHVDFFSFGTNDLTQMTYGFSRDDASKFLSDYYKKDIFLFDPFVRIDEEGVGALIEMAVSKGREVNEKIKIGICGEHGGNPESIKFCYKHDFTYVSCSPYRVPIAVLTSAQQSILKKEKNIEKLLIKE